MRNKIRKFISIGAVVLALAAAAPVLAVESTDTADKVRPEAKDKTTQSNLTAEQKEKFLANRRRVLKGLVDNQSNIIARLVGRLENILKLTESRRDKMAASGIDVSSFDSLISTAKTQKDQAKTLFEEAKTQASEISSAEDPRAATKEFLTTSRQLKLKLLELQKTLRQIVVKMKLVEKAKQNKSKDAAAKNSASSTENTNANE